MSEPRAAHALAEAIRALPSSFVGPLELDDDQTRVQDFELLRPEPPPSDTEIPTAFRTNNGIPSVSAFEDQEITTVGCEGGTATYEVRPFGGDEIVRQGSLEPSGEPDGNGNVVYRGTSPLGAPG